MEWRVLKLDGKTHRRVGFSSRSLRADAVAFVFFRSAAFDLVRLAWSIKRKKKSAWWENILGPALLGNAGLLTVGLSAVDEDVSCCGTLSSCEKGGNRYMRLPQCPAHASVWRSLRNLRV